MTRIDSIAQPANLTTLDAIARALDDSSIKSIDIAVAYITSGGVHDLLKMLDSKFGSKNGKIKKRWITSFDYCRTEPLALSTLLSLPSSSIKIHDADFCLVHGGAPRIPFHPKLFLVNGGQLDYAIAGSGNLSRSGLSRGFEAGFSIGIDKSSKKTEPSALMSLNKLNAWFSTLWSDAKLLDTTLLSKYRTLYKSLENLGNPTPTEDDFASEDKTPGALTDKDLRKLRACDNFWIEAGNITKNRGRHLPGNQLMMKRLSRVYFGFSSKGVPENSSIGDVSITFNSGSASEYSLTYSDNKMDKLVLPIPGNGGPDFYDNQYLLFEATKPGCFNLTLGSRRDKSAWLKKSQALNAAFKMKGGREWGVF